MKPHDERKHSKFSASGAERWLNCSASVALSEQMPEPPQNKWAAEGTLAHELLEGVLKMHAMRLNKYPIEMQQHIARVSARVLRDQVMAHEPDLIIEERLSLEFIHPEMFGTLDVGIAERFGTLHIQDLKYGVHPVSPVKNIQLIIYAIGLAHRYHYDFQKVRLTIYQPRSKAIEKNPWWELDIRELKSWIEIIKSGVDRVESKNKTRLFEGKWCQYCRGKPICPIWKERAVVEASNMFGEIGGEGNEEEGSKESGQKGSAAALGFTSLAEEGEDRKGQKEDGEENSGDFY